MRIPGKISEVHVHKYAQEMKRNQTYRSFPQLLTNLSGQATTLPVMLNESQGYKKVLLCYCRVYVM